MKDIILSRVRAANRGREERPHPGAFPHRGTAPGEAADLFLERFRGNGGEAERFAGFAEARAWLHEFAKDFGSARVGPLLPSSLAPILHAALPPEAALGVSLALAAAAETGTLILESREGRLLQTLPPVHLVWIPEDRIHGALHEALAGLRVPPNAALALHSGPSRSADIGRIMVQGVHGPGRVVAALVPPLPRE